MSLALDIVEALFRTEGVTVEELVRMTDWTAESIESGILNLRESLEKQDRDICLVEHEFQGMIVYRLEPAAGAGGEDA